MVLPSWFSEGHIFDELCRWKDEIQLYYPEELFFTRKTPTPGMRVEAEVHPNTTTPVGQGMQPFTITGFITNVGALPTEVETSGSCTFEMYTRFADWNHSKQETMCALLLFFGTLHGHRITVLGWVNSSYCNHNSGTASTCSSNNNPFGEGRIIEFTFEFNDTKRYPWRIVDLRPLELPELQALQQQVTSPSASSAAATPTIPALLAAQIDLYMMTMTTDDDEQQKQGCDGSSSSSSFK